MLYATAGVTLSEYYSHYRYAAGNSGKKSAGARTETGGVVLQLVRTGDKVKASYSTDAGANFTAIKSDTFATALPEEVYIGLAVTSGNNTDTATGKFANFTIDSTPFAFE